MPLSSSARNASRRRWLLARNRLWVAWLRLPARLAWQETRMALREALRDGAAWGALSAAIAGLPWVVRCRGVVPREVSTAWMQVRAARRA